MKFLKRSGYYIYDPRSNILAELDRDTFLYLKWRFYGIGKPPDNAEKIRSELDRIKDETGFLDLQVDKSYFTEISFPFDEKEVREKLENNLSHLILEVTQDCNFRCKYCVYSGIYRHERTHKSVNMTEEVALEALYFLSKRSKNEEKIRIGFYGGEPFLNFGLIKFVVQKAKEIFKNKEVKFSVTTNGSLLKRETIEFIVKNRIFTYISIDGPEDIHDRYRVFGNGRGTFRGIIKNLRMFKERYPEYFNQHVGYITVLSPPFNLTKVLEFFRNWEFRTEAPHFITLVDPVNTDFYRKYMTHENKRLYMEEYEKLSREEFERFVKSGEPGKFSDFLIHLDDLIKFHNRKQGKLSSTLQISGFCLPGHDRLFVTPDGSLYPCEKVHTHFKIGDLKEGFYYDKIFKTIREILKIREEMECKKCWLGRLCSMCFAKIMRNEEVRRDLVEKECERNRKKWDKVLSYYIEIYERNKKILESLKT